jgi:hypothetical protein
MKLSWAASSASELSLLSLASSSYETLSSAPNLLFILPLLLPDAVEARMPALPV